MQWFRLLNSNKILPFNRWGVLFSHPADFTPVCTTELGVVAKLIPEFEKRNVKVIALSCDPVDSHNGWIKDIQSYSTLSGDFPYPIISDPNRDLAVQLGMVDPVEKDKAGLPLTCRAVSAEPWHDIVHVYLWQEYCTLSISLAQLRRLLSPILQVMKSR